MTVRRWQRGVARLRDVAGMASVRSSAPSAGRRAEIPDLVGGPSVRHDYALDANPSVVVLMPHLSVGKMTGGPNTVFQITERLAARGIGVRYVACFGPVDPDVSGLQHHMQELTGVVRPTAPRFEDRSGADAELAVGRRDVMLATWWPTAHIADRARGATDIGTFIYLIQDFEPAFHPWSTKYALAASTYRMPFRAIVNEPTLLEHLRLHGDLQSDAHDPEWAISFMPAVDRLVFRPRDLRPGPRRIVFYARPKHARNLFELGLRALEQAVQRGAFDDGDWELSAIGGETREWALPGRHVLKPVPRLAYRDYAAYLSESDILLSLMLSPHTSYPPLEMATAGGLVVTNTFSTKTAEALAAISPAIRGVPPDADSLAAAIAQAAKDVSLVRPTPHPTTLPGSWDESLGLVVSWLETTIASFREGSNR